jgi:hypothetical protein
MKSSKIRTYTELCRLREFKERFRYLRLYSSVGESTFGYDRYLNQRFYTSREWRQIRSEVIARDRGCDLGLEGYEIFDRIAIHHMNPMSVDEIVQSDDRILDPEFLITVSHRTHNAIHFGDERLLAEPLVVRRPGDTRLW